MKQRVVVVPVERDQPIIRADLLEYLDELVFVTTRQMNRPLDLLRFEGFGNSLFK